MLVARQVIEARARRQSLQLRGAAVVEHRGELLKAEADAARDGLARVAGEEERVLVGAHREEEAQLRLREVLHLVDKDLRDTEGGAREARRRKRRTGVCVSKRRK